MRLGGTHGLDGTRERRARTAKDTTAGPNTTEGGSHAVAAVGSHGGLDDLEGLAQGGDLKHVEAGSEEQVGELDWLLLQLPGDGRGGGGGHDDGGLGDGEGGPDQGKEGASSQVSELTVCGRGSCLGQQALADVLFCSRAHKSERSSGMGSTLLLQSGDTDTDNLCGKRAPGLDSDWCHTGYVRRWIRILEMQEHMSVRPLLGRGVLCARSIASLGRSKGMSSESSHVRRDSASPSYHTTGRKGFALTCLMIGLTMIVFGLEKGGPAGDTVAGSLVRLQLKLLPDKNVES